MRYQWTRDLANILQIDDLGNVKLLEYGSPEYNAVESESIEAPEVISFQRSPSESDVRSTRNDLLAASDWTQVLDAPIDQAAWATYRQALRDVPDQAGFPDNVTWPQRPA